MRKNIKEIFIPPEKIDVVKTEVTRRIFIYSRSLV